MRLIKKCPGRYNRSYAPDSDGFNFDGPGFSLPQFPLYAPPFRMMLLPTIYFAIPKLYFPINAQFGSPFPLFASGYFNVSHRAESLAPFVSCAMRRFPNGWNHFICNGIPSSTYLYRLDDRPIAFVSLQNGTPRARSLYAVDTASPAGILARSLGSSDLPTSNFVLCVDGKRWKYRVII